jgi:hypothetical protein
MEALQRSVEATRGKAAAAGAKPMKLVAPAGAERRETAARKRKTS